jgi:hypothetical protein
MKVTMSYNGREIEITFNVFGEDDPCHKIEIETQNGKQITFCDGDQFDKCLISTIKSIDDDKTRQSSTGPNQ